MNQNLRNKPQFSQWKNSENVINWFKKIENKNNSVFIKFDIAEFYPSISEIILQSAIRFAKGHVEITDEEKRIIFHCRKSLLFCKNEPWKKKDSDSCFDVAVGSYDARNFASLLAYIYYHSYLL